MPSRSWMAGLAIVALMIAASGRAAADSPVPVERTVNVELQLTGVGPDGCRIEIKPGNPACQFKTVKKTISGEDVREVVELDVIPIVAKATGADHDCSFAITIKEPNKPAKTYRRGLVLSPPAEGQPAAQVLKVYLNAPSLAVKDDKARTKK
jgi:hypothetical protein